MEAATDKPNRFLALNSQFHSVIYAAAGFPLLIQTIDSLRARMAPYLYLNWERRGGPSPHQLAHGYVSGAGRQGQEKAGGIDDRGTCAALLPPSCLFLKIRAGAGRKTGGFKAEGKGSTAAAAPRAES